MLKKLIAFSVCAVVLFSACSKDNTELKSMEQIHQEQGVPVVIREMKPATFSTYLKYPSTLMARSESTAKASISDVVRTIHVKIGDAVKKDQVIISLSQDNPSYQQAKANHSNAQATFRRMETLFASNGVSRQNLDNARTQYEVASAAFKAMDDAINVKAPIDGFITRLDVRVTENVKSDVTLFTVSNLDRVEARIWVSAKDIGLIAPGMTATTEWLGETATGEIIQVNMIMDTEKRAFLVQAEFRNSNRLLTSGLNLDTTLETYRNEKAMFVHRKEMSTEDGAPYVYVVTDGAAERRKVTIGKTQGLFIEIAEGLNPGDLLISEGSQMVSQGSKVFSVAPVSDSIQNF